MISIKCPLYGIIYITKRMNTIINTPEFKRLHNLRQLGITYLEFPSANHTRYEHSIGVSHLTQLLMTSLKKHHLELNITENMIELTQIAGLIHDIGHGPFSHLYDDHFSKGIFHEERGIILFKNMVSKYNLNFNSDEIEYIINCINPVDSNIYDYKFQIVANKMSAIDVDKIDYIQRDSYHLGFGINEKYQELLDSCRVVNYNNNLVLGWSNDIEDKILSLFITRYRLHKNIYCHRNVKSYEIYLKQILKKIFEIDIPWINLTDNIITQSWNNEIIELKNRIDSGQIYNMVKEVVLYNITPKEEVDLQNELKEYITILKNKNQNKHNVLLIKYTIGFGIKDTLKKIVFFDNYTRSISDPQKITGFCREKYDTFIAPLMNDETIYRVYCEY